LLLLSFAGAHRDPSVFPDPDRFDIERDTSELVVFGHGPHYCLGVHLAQTELRGMVEAALEFLPPSAQQRADLTEWQRVMFFRRPQNLPVDFGS